MRKIQCHECGRQYDFDSDDFCPKCGAFTMPLCSSVQKEAEKPALSDKKVTARKEPLFKRAGSSKTAKRKKPQKSEVGSELALEIFGEVLDAALDMIGD